jgi:hypothetical protein
MTEPFYNVADDVRPLTVSGRPGGGVDYSERGVMDALSRGAALGMAGDDPLATKVMRRMRHTGTIAPPIGQGTGGISFATMRPRDPLFYWQQNNLPYDINKPEELIHIRALCRLIYLTHPVLASAIDVMSQFPLAGMEFGNCKSPQVVKFHEELFFEDLDYEQFLPDVGREYWTVGEACAFGSFNETLGVWSEDELLNPDDVRVIKTPFSKEPRFEIRLPKVIRDIFQTQEPRWEYQRLMRNYPGLQRYLAEDAWMPVSNALLSHIPFKADPYHARGIPILMRAFRAVVQEEMLNSAQDAVASRLYTPLILAKLGASASDLGTQQPWIPTDDDLANFEVSLDAALAGDFRVMVHHFAVTMEAVFGREVVPNFSEDFERIMERELQVFGMSKTMLSGADSGETYAADALNRDLLANLMQRYQNKIKRFVHQRMLVVAEAQGHYDYEERGGKRYPVMEEVLVINEEGDEVIVERPRLLVPELTFQKMNLQDETMFHQFLEALSAQGVPISMKTRLTNVPIDLDEEYEQVREEKKRLALEDQRTRRETYLELKREGLPIPEDLRTDFDPRVLGSGDEPGQPIGAMEPALPNVAVGEPAPTEAITPDLEEMVMQEEGETGESGPQAAEEMGVVVPLRRNRQRPPESDEQRKNMPKPAAKRVVLIKEGNELREWDPLFDGPSSLGSRDRVVKDKVVTRETELPSLNGTR